MRDIYKKIKDLARRGRELATAVVACLCVLVGAEAQDQPNGVGKSTNPVDGMRIAIDLSQRWSQWSVLVFGGSLALVLSTSYRRPRPKWTRWSYLLYLPGWALLAVSIHEGSQAQRALAAYVLTRNSESIRFLNDSLMSQLTMMQWGFLAFASWMFIFLVCWILDPVESQ
jgi:hypothetical protein